jgi:hypothetical protein
LFYLVDCYPTYLAPLISHLNFAYFNFVFNYYFNYQFLLSISRYYFILFSPFQYFNLSCFIKNFINFQILYYFNIIISENPLDIFDFVIENYFDRVNHSHCYIHNCRFRRKQQN